MLTGIKPLLFAAKLNQIDIPNTPESWYLYPDVYAVVIGLSG